MTTISTIFYILHNIQYLYENHSFKPLLTENKIQVSRNYIVALNVNSSGLLFHAVK